MRTLKIDSPTDMIALLDRETHFQQIEVNLWGNNAAQNAALKRKITDVYRPCGCTQTSVAILLGIGAVVVFYMLYGMLEYSAFSFGLRGFGAIVSFAAFVKIATIGIAQLKLRRLVDAYHVPNDPALRTTTKIGQRTR
jgi:hypothetical protein